MSEWIPFQLAAELEELTLFEFYSYLCLWFEAGSTDPRISRGNLHRSCLTPPAEAALQRMESGEQPWAHTVRQAAVRLYLSVIFRQCGFAVHGLPRSHDFEVSEAITPDYLSQKEQDNVKTKKRRTARKRV